MAENDDLELSEEQKRIILEYCNKHKTPAIKTLSKIIFKDEDIDGRSKEARAIKKFLKKNNIRTYGAHEYVRKEKVILTDDQKVYVSNNCHNMKAFEIARILFDNNKLSPLDQESRAIYDYIKQLNPVNFFDDTQDDVPDDSEYRPPKTEAHCIARINKYITKKLNKDRITPKQKKDIFVLINYLHNPRFISQINKYDTESDRELFESTFIRYTYDKGDLTEEEVDQYIVLATEVVNASNISDQIQHLTEIRQRIQENDEDNDGRISMSLVESISKSRNEYDQCIKRQKDLLKVLTQDRKTRIEQRANENSSLINLIELWKREESRLEMIAVAERRIQAVEKEVEKIKTMDDLVCRIFGATEDQSVYGN